MARVSVTASATRLNVVDPGKDLHGVIGRRDRIVHLGIYRDWEGLDRLVGVFNVHRAVVDALPETRNARGFAERHKGKGFLNYYSEYEKGSYAWNEKDLIVSLNRTESLDASHPEVSQCRVILPRESDLVREFAGHLLNVARRNLRKILRTRESDGLTLRSRASSTTLTSIGTPFRVSWSV